MVGVVKAFIGNISSKMFNAKILKFYVEGENSSHCSSKLAKYNNIIEFKIVFEVCKVTLYTPV